MLFRIVLILKLHLFDLAEKLSDYFLNVSQAISPQRYHNASDLVLHLWKK